MTKQIQTVGESKSPPVEYRKLYGHPCDCQVRVVEIGGKKIKFCANCLRPTEIEWNEQKHYEEAINQEQE